MADIYFHKCTDERGTPLPAHSSGSRPSMDTSRPPTPLEVGVAELGIGYHRSDPALYIQDDNNQIVKFAYVSQEGQPGLIEIADQAEADAGLDDYRALTPLKLASFSGTFTEPLHFAGHPSFDQATVNQLTVTGHIVGPGGLPVGTIIHFAGAGAAPVGWLECDGSTFNGAQYPELAAVLGTTTLPDCRGLFLRQGIPLQTEAQSTALPQSGWSVRCDPTNTSHTHSINLQTNPSGLHSHAASTTTRGEHSHRVDPTTDLKASFGVGAKLPHIIPAGRAIVNGNASREDGTDLNDTQRIEINMDHSHHINSSGQHDHDVLITNAGSHEHRVTGVSADNNRSHQHTVSISGGDAETRPANIQFRVLIKT